jgi:hypothetical protein
VSKVTGTPAPFPSPVTRHPPPVHKRDKPHSVTCRHFRRLLKKQKPSDEKSKKKKKIKKGKEKKGKKKTKNIAIPSE